MSAARELIDITRPLFPGFPVWPGDAACRMSWTARREEGAVANVAELSLSTHTGTHVDAPLHLISEGKAIGSMPLSHFMGPAVVVDVRGAEVIDLAAVERVLAAGGGDRVLFRTGCWRDAAALPERFPALAPDAARRLSEAGVVLVGTDAPSVDPFESEELPAHRVLGEAGLAIVENLLLDEASEGRYELTALPLRLTAADASPVRAVLRRA